MLGRIKKSIFSAIVRVNYKTFRFFVLNVKKFIKKQMVQKTIFAHAVKKSLFVIVKGKRHK